MIQPKDRFTTLSGAVLDSGECTWDVIDWDQRRFVSVTMASTDGGPEDEVLALSHFRRHIDGLPHTFHWIHVSREGEMIDKSSSRDDDITRVIYYPLGDQVLFPEGVLTIPRDQLEELERLGPNIDLVAYPPDAKNRDTKARLWPGAAPFEAELTLEKVFKYCWTHDQVDPSWLEMNILMRLPRHRSLVPFDRVVIDEAEGRVVGFTINYIPGGTVWTNVTRVFKLKWLRQLIDVVDELNLRYDIGHYDIAPRNLVVNESTDSIMLLDFDRADRIRGSSTWRKFPLEDRNDVKGVITAMYEIVTRDCTLSYETNGPRVLNPLCLDWPQHLEVKLDHPVEAYRQLLKEWWHRRAPALNGFDVSEAPEAIAWPERPRSDVAGVSIENDWDINRQDVLAHGGLFVEWERVPQKERDTGRRFLCSGEMYLD